MCFTATLGKAMSRYSTQIAANYTDFAWITREGYRSFVTADVTAAPRYRTFADFQEPTPSGCRPSSATPNRLPTW
ncbi:hypothetical protein [Amycolatopsis sp. SID8362]|uniref:hypothetical protein n=1 Tax=Amycolatopsis sp. SID8362 TaxID=2690346 RepID=UPI0013707AE9|nr:hypothetical protein [Amycolatopsis sp. SID8362]